MKSSLHALVSLIALSLAAGAQGATTSAMAILDAVVNRRTRSRDILGPDQRISMEVALKSITLWAAWQHFEEDRSIYRDGTQ